MPHDPPMDPDLPNEFQQKSHASTVFFCLLLLAVFVTALSWSGKRGRELKPKGQAPTLEAAGWVNGEAPTKESLAGKVVVVEVWATWCGPCRKMLPHMVKLNNQFEDRGVIFIGLTSEGEDKVETIQSILQNAGAHWRNGWGAGQTIQELGTEFLPSAYVIGPNGQIMWSSADGGDLPEILEQILKQVDSRS
ncbi:MAG: TlpA family protein disulfide reductase [Planctomycetaceae bacterium]|nr:TlpA family protein disulfide reductase [Planctomycetaceae bacterium]